jgi:hypothetical protein
MKRVLIFVFALSTSAAVLAQSTVIEKVWTTSSSSAGLNEFNARINKLATSLQDHHYRNEQHKLYSLFKKTHTTFLRQYSQYANIEELSNGKYDCLTATALFADVLSRTNFHFNIIETNYHIFIVVNTHEGDVILETTDRANGFINDKKQIATRLGEYQKNILEAATPSHHQYSFNLYHSVNTDQLPGLLYFNQAVKAFNAHEWKECSVKLAAASEITDSPRIAELVQLLERQD